jgi:tripeptide aminopeptidase
MMDIVLNVENIILSPSYFKDLIRANFNTTETELPIGADDKAGITEIVTAMEFLLIIQKSNTEN